MVSPMAALPRGTAALVTGASQGIGRAIALRLARDGYNVAVNDLRSNKDGMRDVVQKIKQLGREAVGVEGDVTKDADVTSMVDGTVRALGHVDCLVNNAGIAHIKPLLDSTSAERRKVFDVNALGVFNVAIECARHMVKRGEGGRIINCASVAAFKPQAMLSHYSSSKWAVRGATHGMAVEWAPYGIRANAVAPGIVDTSMWDDIDREIGDVQSRATPVGEGVGKTPPAPPPSDAGAIRDAYVKAHVALQRVSVPDDTANLCSFLAGESSSYITGQTYICDGGTYFT